MQLSTPISRRQLILVILGIAAFAVVSEMALGDESFATGKAKFEAYCGACHKADHTPPLLAPPSFAMQRRYSMEYGEDREAFVNAIAQWVKEPSESKSLMVGARKKFGLMPPLPYPENDVRLIANYLYDASFTMPQDCDPEMENMAAHEGMMKAGKGKAKVGVAPE